MMFIFLSLLMILLGAAMTIKPIVWFELWAIWTEKDEKPNPTTAQKWIVRVISFLILAAGVTYMVLFLMGAL